MEYVNVEIVGSMSRLLDASAQAGDVDHLAARHHCNDSLIEIIFFFMSPHYRNAGAVGTEILINCAHEPQTAPRRRKIEPNTGPGNNDPHRFGSH
jgi:hypothetical protein